MESKLKYFFRGFISIGTMRSVSKIYHIKIGIELLERSHNRETPYSRVEESEFPHGFRII